MLCLVLLVSFKLFAQKTKQVVSDDLSRNTREIYNVLKADNETLEGSYKTYTILKNDLLQEGFYHKDQKDGFWRYYTNKGVILEGSYKTNEKIGIWSAYDAQRKLQVSYDYTIKKLLFFNQQSSDSTTYDVINGTDTTKTVLERPPVYLNGNTWLLRAIARATQYPDDAHYATKQGYVIVSFTIKDDGKLANYRIANSLDPELDKAAIKAAASIEGDWLPGILNGKPVNVKYQVPVKFVTNRRYPTRLIPASSILRGGVTIVQ
jgi:TonB family protein